MSEALPQVPDHAPMQCVMCAGLDVEFLFCDVPRPFAFCFEAVCEPCSTSQAFRDRFPDAKLVKPE